MGNEKVIGLGILLELIDKVQGPAGKIIRAFKDVERTVRLADKAVAFARRNWSMGWKVGLAGTAMTAPFIATTKSILKVNAELERFQTQLITAKGGSVAAGNALLDWAKKFSGLTPFKIPQVVEATSQLEIYGINAKKWLPLIGDMAASMNKDVNSAAYGVAKALTGGGFDVLRESFGITGQILTKYGFQGKMNTPAALNNLAASLAKFMQAKFAGGMERMARTWSGALSMISDAIYQIKAAAGEGLFNKLKEQLNKIVALIKSPAFMQAATRWAKLFGAAMSTVFAWATKLLSPLMAIIKYINELTKTHPALLKYALAFAFIGSAAVAAVGGLLMLVSGIGWVAAGALKTIVLLKSTGFALFSLKYYSVIASGAVKGFFLTAARAVWTFMATNPVGWILLAISAIVMFALAWKNNWLGIGTFMNKAVRWVIGLFVKLWKWITSLPEKFYAAGKKMILGLWEGLKSAIMMPVELFKWLFKTIKGFIPSSPAKWGAFSGLRNDPKRLGEGLLLNYAQGMKGAIPVVDRLLTKMAHRHRRLLQGLSVGNNIPVVHLPPEYPLMRAQLPAPVEKFSRYKEIKRLAGISWLHAILTGQIEKRSWALGELAQPTLAGRYAEFLKNSRLKQIAKLRNVIDKWRTYQSAPDVGMPSVGQPALAAEPAVAAAAAGGGFGGGGITVYRTQHFERGSIQISADRLDWESFKEKVWRAVEEHAEEQE